MNKIFFDKSICIMAFCAFLMFGGKAEAVVLSDTIPSQLIQPSMSLRNLIPTLVSRVVTKDSWITLDEILNIPSLQVAAAKC